MINVVSFILFFFISPSNRSFYHFLCSMPCLPFSSQDVWTTMIFASRKPWSATGKIWIFSPTPSFPTFSPFKSSWWVTFLTWNTCALIWQRFIRRYLALFLRSTRPNSMKTKLLISSTSIWKRWKITKAKKTPRLKVNRSVFLRLLFWLV